ncbi:MAG: hypothetical protein SOR57_09595 [Parabacteroides sp.]|nr:hypothetical protein [Parabacteroides sp.]
MKHLFLSLFLLLSITLYAQEETKVKIDFYAGYENPEEAKLSMPANGYDIGVDFKYYIYNRLYTVASIYNAKFKGEQECLIDDPSSGRVLDGVRKSSLINTFVGLGLGYDFLKIKRHTLYLHGVFGLTSQDEESDDIYEGYRYYNPVRENYVDWGLMGKVGYNYQITRLLSVGVSYNLSWLRTCVSHGVQGGVQVSF